MKNTWQSSSIGLALSTLVVCIVNAVGNIAVLFKVGPTPVLSLVGMALAVATFVASWKSRSYLAAGILATSGIVFIIPGLSAMGYSFSTVVFPGPILGVIIGIVILGLGLIVLVRGMRREKEMTASR